MGWGCEILIESPKNFEGYLQIENVEKYFALQRADVLMDVEVIPKGQTLYISSDEYKKY